MIGLVLITGLVALAVVALIGSAFGRHLIDGVPEPSAGPSSTIPPRPMDRPGSIPGDRTPPHHRRGVHAVGGHDDRPDSKVEPLRHRPALSLTARLAFVHNPEPDTVVLDCTLADLDDDPDDVVPAGTPFTLQLRLPDTAWFATSLELLLEQWASEGRILEIALLARDGHAKAHIGDGSSRLMLEVDSAAGLSVS